MSWHFQAIDPNEYFPQLVYDHSLPDDFNHYNTPTSPTTQLHNPKLHMPHIFKSNNISIDSQ